MCRWSCNSWFIYVDGSDMFSVVGICSALCLYCIAVGCCRWSCNGAFYIDVGMCWT